jgi:DNA-binding IscR family transcriptional regulator
MRRDERLSASLHALLHLAVRAQPITSEELADCLGTHAVVVRRTMGALREAGLVRSERGHGGGWTLARPLGAVTLRDVYVALGEPELFSLAAIGPHSQCAVRRLVGDAISGALEEAQGLLLQRFAAVRLDGLLAQFVDFQRAGHGPAAGHRKEKAR